MVSDKKISDFYANFGREVREVVDDLSGLIFQVFPSCSERIVGFRLIFSNCDLGKFIELKCDYDCVYFFVLKGRFKGLQKKFSLSSEIDLDEIREILVSF